MMALQWKYLQLVICIIISALLFFSAFFQAQKNKLAKIDLINKPFLLELLERVSVYIFQTDFSMFTRSEAA
ncbi:unnamed protein product [Callosobruchus maculatus]|uniref:Uncharacterized protein n=1 Tax=Callosobruchus maculatus TaxID=64391 RepID=A0A653DEY0_CALMS|nr:unnamed protein product [Callosobruchus maculatus]